MRWLAERVARALARVALHGCDAVGRGASLHGWPFVRSDGRLEIGDGFELSSAPVRSHLVVGRGAELRIGRRVRVAHGAAISVYGRVDIGDEVTVGPMAMILDLDYHQIADRALRGSPRPIRIGRGAHLGSGVIVLRGAIIGEGARIAPNSVVSRAIPAGAHAAGVPARPLALASAAR